MSTKIQTTPCCADQPGQHALSVAEARQRILAAVSPLAGALRVPLRQALGQVLAEDLVSRVDVPHQTNSAMDGYALNGDDLPDSGSARLKRIGTSWAGHPYAGRVGPGECVRIMTGASLPEGADTVVMQEQVEADEESIRIDARHRRGQNVRQAGEDLARGQTLLRAGRRIEPVDLGLIASAGIAEVSVYRRLRVAFFSTGDELRSLGEPLDPGCVYDSNRYTLYGMLTRLNAEIIDLGVIPDTREDTRRAFEQAAAMADVVITSGGVSVGDADFVTETLEALGQINFWKVAMKPGRPLAFGTVDGAVFFGLPGNPVSVMVTFYQFAQPALRRMMGETETEVPVMTAITTTALKTFPGRTEFQRGRLSQDENGRLLVTTTGSQGSGVLRSMHEADCLIILPRDRDQVSAGEEVPVQPFHGLI